MLSSTSSKREARSYLQRFTPTAVQLPYLGGAAKTTPKYTGEPALSDSQSLVKPNEAYVSRLLESHANPTAAQFLQPADNAALNPSPLDPGTADEELHVSLVKIRDIDSICDATLHGVGRTLGQLQRLGLFAIVVLDDPKGGDQWRVDAGMRAERITAAIEASGAKARRVDGAFATSPSPPPRGCSLVPSSPPLLLSPLSRGVIPILAPLAFDSAQRIVHVEANDVVRTLAELLSTTSPAPPTAAQPPVSRPVHLDRLIFLDPLGGIPARDRPSGAHVFVNLQQEFAEIEASLRADGREHHLRSLQTIRSALALLPPTASAVITTPEAAAAAHARLPEAEPQHPRIKNPLIHNLLTDKPIFSSSLPTATSPSTQTTLIKHGTPLQLFPRGTKLTSPEVDLAKLVALIEDSFGKTLDVRHYLERVNDHIAGLIIAGDYEGAAVITWETPPANPTAQRVCYLDKFAVARRSQGVGGVADVVFKAMTASVRPGRLFDGAEGIVWRSRRNNPVNKWVRRAQLFRRPPFSPSPFPPIPPSPLSPFPPIPPSPISPFPLIPPSPLSSFSLNNSNG